MAKGLNHSQLAFLATVKDARSREVLVRLMMKANIIKAAAEARDQNDFDKDGDDRQDGR